MSINRTKQINSQKITFAMENLRYYFNSYKVNRKNAFIASTWLFMRNGNYEHESFLEHNQQIIKKKTSHDVSDRRYRSSFFK